MDCQTGRTMTFEEKVEARRQTTGGSMLCVGLDPQLERLPQTCQRDARPFFSFCRAVIQATAPYAAAYKPQFAHFAAHDALEDLGRVMDYLRQNHADIPVILDAKRGDIGSTADYYAREAFEIYGADAVTVNPYMGGDTLQPFLKRSGRGIFVLCRTSNEGSGEFQNLQNKEGAKLFEVVARTAATQWNAGRNKGAVGLVVGATYPQELATIRQLAPDLLFLVPGVGAQGGDLQAVLHNGQRAQGGGLLINSSRGILYPSGCSKNFPDNCAEAAANLHNSILRQL